MHPDLIGQTATLITRERVSRSLAAQAVRADVPASPRPAGRLRLAARLFRPVPRRLGHTSQAVGSGGS